MVLRDDECCAMVALARARKIKLTDPVQADVSASPNLIRRLTS
jgi:hypothetical protein